MGAAELVSKLVELGWYCWPDGGHKSVFQSQASNVAMYFYEEHFVALSIPSGNALIIAVKEGTK